MIRDSTTAYVYTDPAGLSQLQNQAKSDPKGALRETSRQFESLFIQMALKSMRDATMSSGMLDGRQGDFYRDIYDQQLALELGKRSKLGIADLLVRQLGGDDASDSNSPGKTLGDYWKEALPSVVAGKAGTSALPGSKEASLNGDRSLANETNAERRGAVKTAKTLPLAGPKAFVETLWPYAQKAAAELGVDPRVLLAQAALETGWGRKSITHPDGRPSYNLFGIKADRSWNGKRAAAQTLEYENGIGSKQQAAFRAYESYADSFQDYVNFLKSNPRYGNALENASDARKFVHSLQRAGYATDPDYARKVISIYESQQVSLGSDSVNPA